MKQSNLTTYQPSLSVLQHSIILQNLHSPVDIRILMFSARNKISPNLYKIFLNTKYS